MLNTNRFFAKYRLIGKTNIEGETLWSAQVRRGFFNWKNIVTDDLESFSKPYLSNYLTISCTRKERILNLLELWKRKNAYLERKVFIEYIND